MFNFGKEKDELKEKVEKVVEEAKELAEDEIEKVTGGALAFGSSDDPSNSGARSQKQAKASKVSKMGKI